VVNGFLVYLQLILWTVTQVCILNVMYGRTATLNRWLFTCWDGFAQCQY